MRNRSKKTLKICYIYQDQYPWDVRVEKFCNAFAEDDIEVHIVSRNRDGLPLLEKQSKNITIHSITNNKNKNLRDFLNFPAFFSPFWINKIVKVVRKYSIDIIIIRDLPMIYAAIIAAKITNKIVLMDMAENYPALIKSTWDFRGPNFIDYFIRNPYLLKRMEKKALPKLDGIFVVSPQSADRVENFFNFKDKIWVIGNTPPLKGNSSINERDVQEPVNGNSLVLLYVGMVEAHRGIDIAIRAIPIIKKKIPNVKLIVIGTGTYEKNLLENVKQLNIESNVEFKGWIDNSNIDKYIKLADICLIPHYVSEHIDTTLPNKIFDYMAQKKPVLVTQSKSLSAIIKRENCGLVYNDKDPTSLSEAVFSLTDRGYRDKLGENGFKAVMEKYNWNRDKSILLKTIRSITTK